MNRETELLLRINPAGHHIRLETTKNGVTACKEISEDALLECVKRSVKQDGVSSGFLPAHCFHISVGHDGRRDYCLWHPELYADVSYFGTEYPHFPLPRLVFGFVVTPQGKVFDCRMGVVEDGPITEKTEMYVYPFSNVSGFSLCIGNNTLPAYKNSRTLATLPGYLLRLPNNDDRFNAKNNRLHMQYRELLNHLKNKTPAYYYTDVLIPSGKTLKDFINGR